MLYLFPFISTQVAYGTSASANLFVHVQSNNPSKARTHDIQFDYVGLIKCGHCGCQLTAELKKGKYIYYHCTGNRGGTCKKDYIRKEKLDKVFLELIDKIVKSIPEEMHEDLKATIKEMQTVKDEFDANSQEAITKQINTLKRRISNLYEDKLDGRITSEFWEEKNIQWHAEKDKLVNKLQTLNKSSQNFYECSNLLLNFCKNAQRLFLDGSPEKKRQILSMVCSNFLYKDGKLVVELKSVFDFLIKNAFSQTTGNKSSLLELLKHKKIYIDTKNHVFFMAFKLRLAA